MSLALIYGMDHGPFMTLTHMNETFLKGSVDTLEQFLESDEVRPSSIPSKQVDESMLLTGKSLGLSYLFKTSVCISFPLQVKFLGFTPSV
jgi:hypothetical protein